jgi:hypothetical protein
LRPGRWCRRPFGVDTGTHDDDGTGIGEAAPRTLVGLARFDRESNRSIHHVAGVRQPGDGGGTARVVTSPPSPAEPSGFRHTASHESGRNPDETRRSTRPFTARRSPAVPAAGSAGSPPRPAYRARAECTSHSVSRDGQSSAVRGDSRERTSVEIGSGASPLRIGPHVAANASWRGVREARPSSVAIRVSGGSGRQRWKPWMVSHWSSRRR